MLVLWQRGCLKWTLPVFLTFLVIILQMTNVHLLYFLLIIRAIVLQRTYIYKNIFEMSKQMTVCFCILCMDKQNIRCFFLVFFFYLSMRACSFLILTDFAKAFSGLKIRRNLKGFLILLFLFTSIHKMFFVCLFFVLFFLATHLHFYTNTRKYKY